MPALTPQPPASLTSFVGRDREVEAISRLLGAARLVTLTGAGGSGKTRLAGEIMRSAAASFREGAAWIELAAITEPELVTGHIAASLGIGSVGQAPADALCAMLRDSERLIVIDNCEHVVDACAATIDLVLRRCPGVRVLATSREALGVDGERAWLIPLLSVPAVDDGIDAITESEAVRLFVDRARAANGAFVLTAANATAVAGLCRRLDGLPLAIELAAARARAFTPEQMLARLDTDARLLDRGPRGSVARHRTLREAIDWSHGLLTPSERLVFRRLSVFAGELSLDAAEAVCGGDGVDRDDVLDLLAALVDKSLVVVRDSLDEARYHLLETIRQYARERLEASPDAEAVPARHADHYVALVRTAEPHLITPERPAWVDRVQRELDDVRLVLAWTRAHDRPRHVELGGRLVWFWYSSGLWTEGRRWLEDAIGLADTEAGEARAAVLFGAGVIAALQGHGATARSWLEESGTIARALGLRTLAAYADSYVGVALGQAGLPAAEAPTRAALAWFEETGDLYGQRLALVVLATVLLKYGDLSGACATAEEAVRVARAYGLGRELGIALQVLGTVLLHQRELDAAAATIGEALRALRQDPQPFWLARALELMGVAECARGAPLRGARLFGAAERRRERMGAVLFQLDRDRLAGPIAAARASEGDGAIDAAWHEGRTLPFESVVDDAIAHAARRQPNAKVPPARPVASPPGSPAAVCVRALGFLEVERDGVPLPPAAWKSPRSRELFAYLLVHPEGRTREQIRAAFWPDASAAQAKNSFHVMLHHLRRAVGRPDIVVFDDDRYQVSRAIGVDVDVATFEREMAAASALLRANPTSPQAAQRLRDALDLYRGDFLAGENAGDWHIEVRDRMHRVRVDGLEALGAHLVAAELHAAAADVYRRLVQADEWNEEAHRLLMTSLGRSGQRAEALRHYDRLASLLERELGAEPEARTKAVHDQLRRGSLG
jgi:non-specific serine/threonine protein kinase